MRLLFLAMKRSYQTYIHLLEWLLAIAAVAYMTYRLVTYQDYASISIYLCNQSVRVYALIGIAIGLVPVQLFVEAARWRYVLRGWKTISIGESWSQVMLGMLAGFVTPYRTGDIPARLVASGLNISKEELSSRWHQWIRDWHKWFAVGGYTLLRYIVWGIQLWAVLLAVGISMPLGQGIASIALYYVVVSIIPALPAADVALKGGWAVWIFGQYTPNVVAIMVAVSLIWFINTLIPVIGASIQKIIHSIHQR